MKIITALLLPAATVLAGCDFDLFADAPLSDAQFQVLVRECGARTARLAPDPDYREDGVSISISRQESNVGAKIECMGAKVEAIGADAPIWTRD